MVSNTDKLRIFVASPSDVAEERDLVSHVVGEIRRMLEGLLPVELEAVRWETHAWPDIGEDAQDVINREIGEFDILVGIMWRRFGTPTKRARSGTDEEFQRAYKYFRKYGRPKVMFYFRTTPFYTTGLNDLTQFRKVVQFRKELEKQGVLFWEYDTPLQFERNVREHLVRQVLSLVQSSAIPPSGPPPTEPPEGPTVLPQKPAPVVPRGGRNVFLAYSREDRAQVKQVYEVLKIAGFNPWLDVEKLLPGQKWKEEVRRAIEAADVILVFLSANSISKRGFFEQELRSALEVAQSSKKEGVLIPVRLDQIELLSPLAQYQAVDYFLSDGIERIVSTIQSFGERKR